MSVIEVFNSSRSCHIGNLEYNLISTKQHDRPSSWRGNLSLPMIVRKLVRVCEIRRSVDWHITILYYRDSNNNNNSNMTSQWFPAQFQRVVMHELTKWPFRYFLPFCFRSLPFLFLSPPLPSVSPFLFLIFLLSLSLNLLPFFSFLFERRLRFT